MAKSVFVRMLKTLGRQTSRYCQTKVIYLEANSGSFVFQPGMILPTGVASKSSRIDP